MYREHALRVEAELASVQGQLADARKQLHTLTTILTKSAHTIQTALQVIPRHVMFSHVHVLLIFCVLSEK